MSTADHFITEMTMTIVTEESDPAAATDEESRGIRCVEGVLEPDECPDDRRGDLDGAGLVRADVDAVDVDNHDEDVSRRREEFLGGGPVPLGHAMTTPKTTVREELTAFAIGMVVLWLGFKTGLFDYVIGFVTWVVKKTFQLVVGFILLELLTMAAALVWCLFYDGVLGIKDDDDPG